MLERVEKGIHEHDSQHTTGGSKGAAHWYVWIEQIKRLGR